MADIKSLSMTLADAIDSIRDNITVAGMAEMIEHTINAALRRTLDAERSELQARLDAEAWADTEIRRTYGAEFGLHEEGDSPPCWEDFANHIRALRTALTPTTDGEREAREALARCDAANFGGQLVNVDHLRTALALLAAERAEHAMLRASLTVPERYVGVVTEAMVEEVEQLRAKAADAARERAAIVTWLRGPCNDPFHDVRWCSTCESRSDYADAIERGAHNKVTP